MTKTDATCWALISATLGLLFGLYLGCRQTALFYEMQALDEPVVLLMRAERLTEVEKIEPEEVR